MQQFQFTKEVFRFNNSSSSSIVCGVNDCNISYIQNLLSVRLGVWGDVVSLTSESPDKQQKDEQLVVRLLNRLQVLSMVKDSISESDIYMEYKRLIDENLNADSQNKPEGLSENDDIFISIGNKYIYPKTYVQKEFINAIRSSKIVFAYGPAGTGKTFLAVNYALSELIQGKKQKIVFTRPVVEVGESLGFLPGDVFQKLDPYLRPFYDSMEAFLPSSAIHRYIDNGQIEIVPLAYMRGRSLNNSFIILDEAQNTLKSQMKMFLTRIGENSTAVITGDLSQTDLTDYTKSGLADAVSRFRNIEGISFVEFTSKDTVRSRMVQRIIDAYQSKSE